MLSNRSLFRNFTIPYLLPLLKATFPAIIFRRPGKPSGIKKQVLFTKNLFFILPTDNPFIKRTVFLQS